LKTYYTYILASKKNGTLYVGITSDLVRRVYQHRNKEFKGFTEKYDICLLVHFELFDNPINAITREKQLKKWKRDWKIKLIESNNPDWQDLYKNII